MTRVELAAIIMRDGAIFLIRRKGGAWWELPGDELQEGRDDIPREMNEILDGYGIETPSIEEDFLETHFLAGRAGPGVLNLYAPSAWTGEPSAPDGGESAWFTLEQIAALPMDEQIRAAVLQSFGLEIARDPAEEAIATVLQFPGPRPAERDTDVPGDVPDALDVLSTLSGRPPDEALDGLRQRYGEIAHDVLDAIDRSWTGPALPRRTRSFLVVAMVAAMGGRPAALRSHIEGALNHGASREEMVEVARMIATYGGFPAAIEAWPVIEEALNRRGMGRAE